MAEKNRNSGRPNLVGENYGTKEDFERIFGVQEKNYLEEEDAEKSLDQSDGSNFLNKGI